MPPVGPLMESHVTDITHVIQLSVAPAFLLVAMGTLITILSSVQKKLGEGTPNGHPITHHFGQRAHVMFRRRIKECPRPPPIRTTD